MDLELRPWQADDRDAVVEAASDPYVERAGLRREGFLRSFVVYGDRVADAYLYAAVRGDV